MFTADAGAAVGMLLLQTLGVGNYNVFGSVVTTCSIAPGQMSGPSGETVARSEGAPYVPGLSGQRQEITCTKANARRLKAKIITPVTVK